MSNSNGAISVRIPLKEENHTTVKELWEFMRRVEWMFKSALIVLWVPRVCVQVIFTTDDPDAKARVAAVALATLEGPYEVR